MPAGYLEIKQGPYQDIVLTIPDKGEVIVGRGEDCTLTIEDANVSKHHFAVAFQDAGPAVRDCESSSGTFLDGVKMEAPQILTHGATIRAGTTVFTYRELARSPHSEEYTGRIVGRYRVGVCIGSGGMGEVYKAVQQGQGRALALKILAPELKEDREYVTRFLQEARSAGQLTHPNVIQVFDVREDNGTYYYSMEFVEGGSVQDLISDNQPLPQKHAAEIILEAARALEFAEKKNIIHCDIKPDNLMLTADGHVKLADLGIAKRLTKGRKTKGEKDGVLGSPYYMSPEQAMGRPLDRRTDIYSLGTTFYHLLTGIPPFQGDSSREVMEKQVYKTPIDISDLVWPLHLALRRIVNKMMEKSPAKRYQSAGKLIADLERVLPRLPEGETPKILEPVQDEIPPRVTTRMITFVCVVIAAVMFLIALFVYFACRKKPASRPEGKWKGRPAACRVFVKHPTAS